MPQQKQHNDDDPCAKRLDEFHRVETSLNAEWNVMRVETSPLFEIALLLQSARFGAALPKCLKGQH